MLHSATTSQEVLTLVGQDCNRNYHFLDLVSGRVTTQSSVCAPLLAKQRVSTPSGVKMALNPGNHMMRVYFRAARLATLRCAFTVRDSTCP